MSLTREGLNSGRERLGTIGCVAGVMVVGMTVASPAEASARADQRPDGRSSLARAGRICLAPPQSDEIHIGTPATAAIDGPLSVEGVQPVRKQRA